MIVESVCMAALADLLSTSDRAPDRSLHSSGTVRSEMHICPISVPTTLLLYKTNRPDTYAIKTPLPCEHGKARKAPSTRIIRRTRDPNIRRTHVADSSQARTCDHVCEDGYVPSRAGELAIAERGDLDRNHPSLLEPTSPNFRRREVGTCRLIVSYFFGLLPSSPATLAPLCAESPQPVRYGYMRDTPPPRHGKQRLTRTSRALCRMTQYDWTSDCTTPSHAGQLPKRSYRWTHKYVRGAKRTSPAVAAGALRCDHRSREDQLRIVRAGG